MTIIVGTNSYVSELELTDYAAARGNAMRKTPSSDGVLCFKSLILLNSSRKEEFTDQCKLLILLNSFSKPEIAA